MVAKKPEAMPPDDRNAALAEKIEMPRIEPPPHVEIDLQGTAQWLKHMPTPYTPKCEFVCTLEWSWTPYNERMESYYLQRARTHWVLWLRRFDDNWGKWNKPGAIARYVWKDCISDHAEGLGQIDWHNAAMILLRAVFAEEIRQYSDPGRFDVTSDGLLFMDELDAVADAVWGKERASDEETSADG